MGSVCLLVSSIDEVVIERNRNFSSARSGWNLRKTLVFSKSKCYFQAVRWPNIPCMLSQCYLDEWIWNVGCIQYLAGFSTSFRWKILRKIQFSINFLLYQKFSTFSLPQIEACQFNWGTFQAKCILMGFFSSLDFERTFLKNLFAMFVK